MKDGLDLLGLRLPVQHIGAQLLDGITTVTPSVRYVAIRSWLAHRYMEAGLPDSWTDFTGFCSNFECALVLGNLLQDRSINGLIGPEEGLAMLAAGDSVVNLAPLVKTPAATIYTGASDQLGISWFRPGKMPGLTPGRGLRLAQAVDTIFSANPLVNDLLAVGTAKGARRDDIAALGQVGRIDQIPHLERECLLQAIVPSEAKSERELARVGTYAALLALAEEKKKIPTERELFDATCSLQGLPHQVLGRASDGWLRYCVRDALAVSQEAVMAAVISQLNADSEHGRYGVEADAVVLSLLERIDEQNAPLRALGLLEASHSVADMNLTQLMERVDALTRTGRLEQRGINRWLKTITEPVLYDRALTAGAGALSMAVVIWIVAVLRVSGGVREAISGFDALSYQGERRIGFREIVLPEMERLIQEDATVLHVAGELAFRTVRQHLQIAWSRLQIDTTRDVSLLSSESSKWISRGKNFKAGRTASRLQQAVGWMQQLQLINAAGITTDGQAVLKTALQTLSSGVPQ
jgi:hypothetical protein